MAKCAERITARDLRKDGRSIKSIARSLDVAPSTVSGWCRDIEISEAQIAALSDFVRMRGYAGRMKGARMHRERRLERVREGYSSAMKDFSSLSKRDLLIAGIALYWAEGGRKGARRFRFANSDPTMVRFILRWLHECFGVSIRRVSFRVLINESHRDRESAVVQFWRRCTSAPPRAFRRTIFIHANTRKEYSNRDAHFGTLHMEVLRGSDIIHRVHGFLALLSGRSLDDLLQE